MRPAARSPSVPSLTIIPGGVTHRQGEYPSDLFFPPHEQRRPGLASPPYAIPREHWPDVLRRVDQGESYRRIAQDYHTSYESVRRVVLAMRKQQNGGEG